VVVLKITTSWQEHYLLSQLNRLIGACLTPKLIASFLNAVTLALANIANEVKAEDIRILYVKPGLLDPVLHHCHCFL
jgi:hypothetical protein